MRTIDFPRQKHHTHCPVSSLSFPSPTFSLPVPTYGPILGIGQPVVEAMLLDKGGDPVGFLIVRQELLLDSAHRHEPGRDGLVDQGSIRTPTEWVGMRVCRLVHQPALGFQELTNVSVCRFDVLSHKVT